MSLDKPYFIQNNNMKKNSSVYMGNDRIGGCKNYISSSKAWPAILNVVHRLQVYYGFIVQFKDQTS